MAHKTLIILLEIDWFKSKNLENNIILMINENFRVVTQKYYLNIFESSIGRIQKPRGVEGGKIINSQILNNSTETFLFRSSISSEISPKLPKSLTNEIPSLVHSKKCPLIEKKSVIKLSLYRKKTYLIHYLFNTLNEKSMTISLRNSHSYIGSELIFATKNKKIKYFKAILKYHNKTKKGKTIFLKDMESRINNYIVTVF